MELELDVSLNVLSRIRGWQTLHGLKRGNFRSYRRFCIRKSNKLRKKHKMEFNHKRKFSKERFEKLFLRRNIWDPQITLSFQKKPKGVKDPEPVSQERAQKMVQDLGQTLLLFIGRLIREEPCYSERKQTIGRSEATHRQEEAPASDFLLQSSPGGVRALFYIQRQHRTEGPGRGDRGRLSNGKASIP